VGSSKDCESALPGLPSPRRSSTHPSAILILLDERRTHVRATRPALVTSIVAAAALAALPACSVQVNGGGSGVRGSGKPITQTRDIGTFTRIRMEGAVDVLATSGPVRPAKVNADDNIVGLVTTTIEGDTLVVATSKSYSTNNPVAVTVQAPGLDGAQTSGSGDLRLVVSGAPKIEVSTSGSGDVAVEGTADTATLDTSGSGVINATRLDADEVTVDSSGSGDAQVGSPSALTATSSGSGDIRYATKPARLTEDASGSGDIGPR
jgi:hypothetical protein